MEQQGNYNSSEAQEVRQRSEFLKRVTDFGQYMQKEMQAFLDTLDTIESKETFLQIDFHDMSQEDSPCICLWKNWSGVVPRIGDTVLLQFGEYKEIEKSFAVIGRTVSGITPDKVKILLIPQDV